MFKTDLHRGSFVRLSRNLVAALKLAVWGSLCRGALTREHEPRKSFMPESPSITLPAEVRLIVQRLAQMSPDRVYLFGSHARGEAGPDSDLDFLVVIPRSDKSRYERAVEARGFVRGIVVPKDIIVLTRAEWEKEIKAPSSLSSTVLREGIALHS